MDFTKRIKLHLKSSLKVFRELISYKSEHLKEISVFPKMSEFLKKLKIRSSRPNRAHLRTEQGHASKEGTTGKNMKFKITYFRVYAVKLRKESLYSERTLLIRRKKIQREGSLKKCLSTQRECQRKGIYKSILYEQDSYEKR